MTMKSICYSTAMAAALLLPAVTLPAAAFGQTQTPAVGADAPPPAQTATPPRAKAAARQAMAPEQRVEQHITQLHRQLKITPEQQSQWDQFAQVMRENAKTMDQALQQRASGFDKMNAVDNMQSYAQIAQQHAQDTQKLATAFQMLYASMSDDQKQNADAVFQARSERAAQRQKGQKG